MRARIYFRTLRFVAYQWALPLVVGLCLGAVLNLSGMASLASDIVAVCQQGQGA